MNIVTAPVYYNMKATMTFRINLSSYRKIRRIYPKLREESMASYFSRLANFLEKVHAEWGGYDETS